MDKLDKVYSKQWDLNNSIFKKHGISEEIGDLFLKARQVENLGANSNTNIWLRKFTEALKDEVRELEQELLWKWWSKDKLDMQNIRVEIIDIFHFFISLAQVAGLSPDDILKLYLKKNKVNNERQENDYSKANKDENDNKGIE